MLSIWRKVHVIFLSFHVQILQIDNTSEEEGSLQCSCLVSHQWRFKNEKGPCYAFLVMSYCVTRNEPSSSLVLSIWRICTRNDKKITWTFLVLKAWCDTKQENCNEPTPSLVLSIWRICTRNNKKITWTFLVLKASLFDHVSYPPCSPSCVIFFLSVSQIDYPVSQTDYTTDDSSRIDSNRVDSTTHRLHNGRF